MNEREVIIAVLRKQLAQINKVCCKMKDMSSEIHALAEELEDESRLGLDVKYDYGMDKLKASEKTFLKKLSSEIKTLKHIQTSLEKIQLDSSHKIPPEMGSYSKE